MLLRTPSAFRRGSCRLNQCFSNQPSGTPTGLRFFCSLPLGRITLTSSAKYTCMETRRPPFYRGTIMTIDCCVFGCGNSYKKNPLLSFFCIPSVRKNQGKETEELTERRRKAWLKAINRKNLNDNAIRKWHVVCSEHFITGMLDPRRFTFLNAVNIFQSTVF